MATVKGGDQAAAKLKRMMAKLSTAKEVRIGFLEDATYPEDGTPVATVAAIENFGAPEAGIPPRPFFTDMIDTKSPTWAGSMGRILKNTGYNAEKTLDLMGQGIAGQLRTSIRDTNSPPLSPKTIARKGFEKPLVETGHMLQSVDSEVTS